MDLNHRIYQAESDEIKDIAKNILVYRKKSFVKGIFSVLFSFILYIFLLFLMGRLAPEKSLLFAQILEDKLGNVLFVLVGAMLIIWTALGIPAFILFGLRLFVIRIFPDPFIRGKCAEIACIIKKVEHIYEYEAYAYVKSINKKIEEFAKDGYISSHDINEIHRIERERQYREEQARFREESKRIHSESETVNTSLPLKKALELFGYASLDDVTEETLKINYKRLMVLAHPDANNLVDHKTAAEINKAYNLLKTSAKK